MDHINKGRALIQDPLEAVKAAELNLMASELMRTVAAFGAAVHYLSTGIQLLPRESWQENYALTLALHTASAELALLIGDLSQAELLALTAEANTHTLLEKTRIVSIRMDSYVIQNQLDQVIELGIATLRLLDFELETAPLPSSVVETMFQRPEMTDPRALMVCRFAEPLISAAFSRNAIWLEQFINFYINLLFSFGNPPGASFIYITYAVQLLSRFDELEQGRKETDDARRLAIDRPGNGRRLDHVLQRRPERPLRYFHRPGVDGRLRLCGAVYRHHLPACRLGARAGVHLHVSLAALPERHVRRRLPRRHL